MVELDPNTQFLGKLRLSMAQGSSFKLFLINYCKEDSGVLSQQMASLLLSYQQNKPMYDFVHTESHERELLLDLVWRGLNGESIVQNADGLEKELELRGSLRIEQHIKTLPIKVLLIVMCFHFPALLILSFLPIAEQLKEVLL